MVEINNNIKILKTSRDQRFMTFLELKRLSFANYYFASEKRKEELDKEMQAWVERKPITEVLNNEQLEILQNLYGLEENFKEKDWNSISFKQKTVLKSYNLAPDTIPYNNEDAVFYVNNTESLKDLKPCEISAFANVLHQDIQAENETNSSIDDRIKRAYSKLLKTIESKVTNYSYDKIDIDINSIEYMEDFLKFVDKDNPVKETAKLKIDKLIKEFEERYGITDTEKVSENISKNYKNLAEIIDKNILVSNKEFETIYKALKNLNVRDEKEEFLGYAPSVRQFIGKKNNQLIKNSEVDLFIKAVKQKTFNEFIAKDKKASKEEFNEALKENFIFSLVELSIDDKIGEIQSKPNNFKNNHKKLMKHLEKGTPLNINQGTFISYFNYQNRENENFAKYIGGKVGNKVAASNIKKRVKNSNAVLEEKYGKRHLKTRKFLYTAIETVAWFGAYGFVGANPIGLTALAAIACAKQVYQMRKEYLREKEEARRNGKTLKVIDYLKKNPVKTTFAALSAASAVTPFAALASAKSQTIGKIMPTVASAIATSKIVVGASIAAKALAPHLWNAVKNPSWKNWAKIGGTIAIAYAAYKAGDVIGRDLGVDNHTPTHTPEVTQTKITPADVIKNKIKHPEMVDEMATNTFEGIHKATVIEQYKVDADKMLDKRVDDLEALKMRKNFILFGPEANAASISETINGVKSSIKSLFSSNNRSA